MSTIRPVGDNGYEVWSDADVAAAYADWKKTVKDGVTADIEAEMPCGLSYPVVVEFGRNHATYDSDPDEQYSCDYMSIGGQVYCADSVNGAGIVLLPGTWMENDNA